MKNRVLLLQGCLQELTSWEGLWGGTYTLVYDIKERLENLRPRGEPRFSPFSLGRTAPTGDISAILIAKVISFIVQYNSSYSSTLLEPQQCPSIPMTNEYMYSTILLFHTLLLLLEKNQIFGPNTLQFLVIFFSPFIKLHVPVYTPAQLKFHAILCTEDQHSKYCMDDATYSMTPILMLNAKLCDVTLSLIKFSRTGG